MWIHNITVHVEPSIEQQWLKWMKEVHIPAYLATKQCNEVKIYRVISDQDLGGVSYATQLFCASEENYQTFIKEHADALNQSVRQQFGESLLSFSTQLKEISIAK